jgi:hypothetical protein
MSYDVIRLAADKLSYREKLKLSQYLIQAALKEEEEIHPEKRIASDAKQQVTKNNEAKENTIDYIKERLLKSKPSKRQTLSNFIGAMFQFQGGIKDEDIDTIINKLVKEKFLVIDGNKINYNAL